MGRKIYLSLVFFLFTAAASYAQSGEIKGKIVDKHTKEPVPFATVTAELNGTVVGGAQTDIDGHYSIKPLSPGRYNVKAMITGSSPAEVTGVLVAIEKFSEVNVEISQGVELNEVVVSA